MSCSSDVGVLPGKQMFVGKRRAGVAVLGVSTHFPFKSCEAVSVASLPYFSYRISYALY